MTSLKIYSLIIDLLIKRLYDNLVKIFQKFQQLMTLHFLGINFNIVYASVGKVFSSIIR